MEVLSSRSSILLAGKTITCRGPFSARDQRSFEERHDAKAGGFGCRVFADS